MATKKTTGETKSAAQIRYEATHMPELEQREVLRNLHFTDTGLNPSDADYEMKVLVLTAYLQNKNKEGGHDGLIILNNSLLIIYMLFNYFNNK